MSFLVWIVLGVLALKVVWNFGVPYALMRMPIEPKTGKRCSISLSLEIEFFLLFFATGLSWLSNGDAAINRPLLVLGAGGTAILASYIHFFLGGAIANWMLARKNRPPSEGT